MLAWLPCAEEPCGFDQFGCVCFQEQETIVLYFGQYLMLFNCICAHFMNLFAAVCFATKAEPRGCK